MTTPSASAPTGNSTIHLSPAKQRSPIETVVGAAMIAAPVLFFASTVAWVADAEGARAPLLLWGAVSFAILFAGFAFRLRTDAPRGAALVLFLGMAASCAGAAYALEVAVVDHFGIERLNEQDSLVTLFTLQIPGIMLPLSLLLTAELARRHGLLPPVLAVLMALGAIGFPMSRIPEVAEVALVADGLLCAALVPAGIAVLRGTASRMSGTV